MRRPSTIVVPLVLAVLMASPAGAQAAADADTTVTRAVLRALAVHMRATRPLPGIVAVSRSYPCTPDGACSAPNLRERVLARDGVAVAFAGDYGAPLLRGPKPGCESVAPTRAFDCGLGGYDATIQFGDPRLHADSAVVDVALLVKSASGGGDYRILTEYRRCVLAWDGMGWVVRTDYVTQRT